VSVDPKQQQQQLEKKVIEFKVTEEELQNTIYPVMHDSAIISLVSLTMIYPDIVSALLRPVLDGALPHEEKACSYHCREGSLAEMG
jgi:hypothetical protein